MIEINAKLTPGGLLAEGVENAAQRDFLASHGCLLYQGYFFSQALPLAGFEDLVRQLQTA